MPHLFFPGQPVRFESPEAAANLERKGWSILPEQPDPTATWDGTQWVTPPPPDPVPQWVAFGAVIAGNAAVNTLVATAAQAAPVLHLMLGVGLGQAAQGDPQTFTAAWSAAVAGGLVSAELIAEMQEIAATYDLPAEFIEGLAALP